jgi:hypothetical protein
MPYTLAMTFVDKLRAIRQKNRSCLGLRLDILADKMPLPLARVDDPLLPFAQALIDATRDLACTYILDPAFYLSEGAAGMIALERITRYVPGDIPVVLDTRFGQLGESASPHARGSFEAFRADAVTFSHRPDHYTLAAFLKYANRALFVPVDMAIEDFSSDRVGLVIDSEADLEVTTEVAVPRLIRHGVPDTIGVDRLRRLRLKLAEVDHDLIIVESDPDLVYVSRGEDFTEAVREIVARTRQALEV